MSNLATTPNTEPSVPPSAVAMQKAVMAAMWLSDTIDGLSPDQKTNLLYGLGGAAVLLLIWPSGRDE